MGRRSYIEQRACQRRVFRHKSDNNSFLQLISNVTLMVRREVAHILESLITGMERRFPPKPFQAASCRGTCIARTVCEEWGWSYPGSASAPRWFLRPWTYESDWVRAPGEDLYRYPVVQIEEAVLTLEWTPPLVTWIE